MKPIYLEPDEEITSVVDKISDLSDRRVAIVVPKNSTLFQSLINLKLLAKEAKKQDKDIAIISTNRVGQRLAQQVGFTTYNSLGGIAPEASAAPKGESAVTAKKPVEPVEETVINGVRVNQYHPDLPAEALGEELPTSEAAELAEALEDEVPAAVAAEALASAATVAAADSLPIAKKEPIIEEEALPEPAPTPKDGPVSATALPVLGAVGGGSEPPRDTPSTDSPSQENPGELPPIVSRSIKMSAPREPIVIPWKSVGIASAVAVLILAMLYFFLPKATVVLTLPAQALNHSQDLTVSTEPASGQDNTIAGNQLTSAQSDKKTITATGKKDVGTKATGNITLYNKASSSPVTVPANTTLTASSKTFVLDKAATIPGASVSGGSVVPGQVPATITATAAGDSFNLNNVQFTISNQPALVYGTGSTTGGTTKQVTVLAQSDIDGAITELKASLLTKATDDLKAKAEQQTIVDNSTWSTVTAQTVDQAVGAQVSTAILSISLEAGVIAFDQRVATNAVKAAASKEIKSSEELIIPTDKPITLAFKSVSDNKAAMTVTAALNGFVVQKIDKVAVAKAIARKSKSAAAATLKDQFKATEVKTTLRPGWWPGQLPFLWGAITVEHGFDQSAVEAPPSPVPSE